MAIKSVEVNTLNIFLILVSLVLAFQFPFELFILAYAVLGPLHYITEINWLGKKGYFIKNKNQVWLLVGLSILIAIPFTLFLLSRAFPRIEALQDGFWEYIRPYSASFAFAALITAMVLTFTRKWWIVLATLIVTFLFGLVFEGGLGYSFVFSGLLPTILHVFVFTIFFMLYGAMKDKSKTGYVATALMLVVPFIIMIVPIEFREMFGNKYFMDSFKASKFENINYSLGYVLGFFDGYRPTYARASEMFVRLQVFVAFAYTYHYLNWFSKTTVIGWHKVVTPRKLVLILGIWGLSVFLYFYNYFVGFVILLFLSYLHVLMEFPLNWVSIREVGRKIFVRSKLVP